MRKPSLHEVLGNKHFRLFLLCVGHFCYLVVGAVVFGAIEGPGEAAGAVTLRKLRNDFMARSSKCISDDQLEAFIVQVIEANNRGVSATRNVTVDPNWSFGASLFFASSVLTTIGYGHVAPLSDSGKLFCIAYALIGLPLTLVLMTAIVQRLMVPTEALLYKLENVAAVAARRGRLLAARLLHLLLICAIVFLLACIVPSIILQGTEKEWRFTDAMYFCFITLMTIGLGDYVPGDQPDQPDRSLYKIGAAMFLFFGLALVMLVLATIRNIRELDLGKFFYIRTRDAGGEHARLIAEPPQHLSHDRLHSPHDHPHGAAGGISIILDTCVVKPPTSDLDVEAELYEMERHAASSQTER